MKHLFLITALTCAVHVLSAQQIYEVKTNVFIPWIGGLHLGYEGSPLNKISIEANFYYAGTSRTEGLRPHHCYECFGDFREVDLGIGGILLSGKFYPLAKKALTGAYINICTYMQGVLWKEKGSDAYFTQKYGGRPYFIQETNWTGLGVGLGYKHLLFKDYLSAEIGLSYIKQPGRLQYDFTHSAGDTWAPALKIGYRLGSLSHSGTDKLHQNRKH